MRRTTAVVLLFLAPGCSGENPVGPMDPLDDPSPPTTTGNVVTITTTGVHPRSIQIQLGERVLFVNNDTVAHEMSSDSHPSHLACPQINQVGHLEPGQQRETGNFVVVEICTFHDHLDDLNPMLLGSIVVVE